MKIPSPLLYSLVFQCLFRFDGPLWVGLPIGVENAGILSRRRFYPVCAAMFIKTLSFCVRTLFPLASQSNPSLHSNSTACFFDLFLFTVHMSPSRNPMPSFTLVLTSGCDALPSTTIQFDSFASPKMFPAGPDSLMVHD
jgi:hypothetical protein